MKIYCCQAFYTPLSSNIGVYPKIEKGKRESVWIKSRTKGIRVLKTRTREYIRHCFGIEITDITFNPGHWIDM
jgi:hypothetical protein